MRLVPPAQAKTPEKTIQPSFDEQTINSIGQYFRIEDRDALLKYLRDMAVSESLK